MRNLSVLEHSLFQFTPLREGRLVVLPVPPFWAIFQFTPLREGRLDAGVRTRRKDISIHAPA